MKLALFDSTLTLSLGTLLAAMPVAAFGDDTSQPTETPVALQRVYVPEGFDDNDVTQVVVTGEFSDTCHKVGPTEVSVNRTTGKLQVKQKAYRYTEECHRTIVPFMQVVSVGLLSAGSYEISDASTSTTLGKLSVALATKASADDFLYAPVVDADVARNEVEVRGHFTDRCTKLQNILVTASKDTIVVQPIVKRYGDYAHCDYELVPFRARRKLPDDVARGTYLLHVRSMSGSAVNKFVAVRR
jgi:hypothetical protein